VTLSHRRRLRVRKKLWEHDHKPPPASDARIPGGLHARCILCGSRTQLRLSHVIPKWAFKWHRDAWAGKVKGFYLSIGVATEEQDANKHYLMCDRCEHVASGCEQYIKIIVSGSWREKLKVGIVEPFSGCFLRIDAGRIAQFVSVTALRCHYASSAPFHKIAIPSHLRKQLRQMARQILPTRQPPWVGAVKFVPPCSAPDHDPRCDISAQFEVNDILGPVFAALVGGWEWYIWFKPGQAWLSKVSIRRRWLIRVGYASFEEYRGVKRMSEIIAPYRDKLKFL
jgi:hypothetical protein